MRSWLREDPTDKAATVGRQLSQIVTFLRGRTLLHIDGHFDNMRTDGKRIYHTDFGLATSPHFDLSPAEHDFAQRNATHDAGYAAMRLVKLAGHRRLRDTRASHRRPRRPQRLRTQVRHRPHPQ